MEKIRQVIAYKNYFEDFLFAQPVKVQDKIYKIIEAIETLERIPANYLKFIQGTKGLYEARIQWGLTSGEFSAFLTRENWLSYSTDL